MWNEDNIEEPFVILGPGIIQYSQLAQSLMKPGGLASNYSRSTKITITSPTEEETYSIFAKIKGLKVGLTSQRRIVEGTDVKKIHRVWKEVCTIVVQRQLKKSIVDIGDNLFQYVKDTPGLWMDAYLAMVYRFEPRLCDTTVIHDIEDGAERTKRRYVKTRKDPDVSCSSDPEIVFGQSTSANPAARKKTTPEPNTEKKMGPPRTTTYEPRSLRTNPTGKSKNQTLVSQDTSTKVPSVKRISIAESGSVVASQRQIAASVVKVKTH